MSVIIPNSGDTTGGNPFASLSQSEPDSTDFEILGNAHRSGVISGLEVTTNGGSTTTVSVSGGIVVVNGVTYVVSGVPAFALPTAPTNTRFDAVVARVTGSTASLKGLPGNDSSDNPSTPKSRSIVSVFDSDSHIDFDTDVVLAVVFRNAGTPVTAKEIVDKRVPVKSAIFNQGTTVPTTGTVGELFYKKDVDGSTSARSGVYVRTSGGTQVELASHYEPSIGVPIGGMIMWPANGLPTNFVLADGVAKSKDTYPELYAKYGSTYGETSTTFGIPDMNSRFPRAAESSIGSTGGVSQVTLTESHMPTHDHSMVHTHTHSHTHGMSHDHDSATTGSDSHVHYAESGNTTDRYPTGPVSQWLGSIQVQFGSGSGYYSPAWSSGANIALPASTSSDSHTHTIPSSSHSGSTAGASTSTTSGASSSTTGDTGGSVPFSILPSYMNVKFVIRAK